MTVTLIDTIARETSARCVSVLAGLGPATFADSSADGISAAELTDFYLRPRTNFGTRPERAPIAMA